LKRISIIIFALLLIVACSKKQKNEVQVKFISLKKDIFSEDTTDGQHKYHIDFKFPQIINYPDKDVMENENFELNKVFFGDEDINMSNNPDKNFKNYISALSESYQIEALSLVDKLPEMAKTLNYELIKKSDVIYNKNKVLSFAFQTYSFTGGTHGISNIGYLHFDMNTGLSFDIDDLFDKTNKQILQNLVSDKCEEMKKEKENQLFDDSKIESIDNFYFDDKNFYFVYNPYEIAAYSVGYVTIKIPKSKIKPLLKKDIQPGFMKN
jgi:hypothetical protein